MPVVSERVHPRGLDFTNQRKVVLLREVHGMAWEDISARVKNRLNQRPSWKTCSNVYDGFARSGGCRKYKYKNCGRTAWKATPAIEAFILRKVRQLRKKCVCTSTTLQAVVAREQGVTMSAWTIRRVLQRHGYKWSRRANKRVYGSDEKAERKAFARKVLRMSRAQLRASLSLAMDGVIFGMPPGDPVDRLNHCRFGDGHVWRKPGEGGLPELGGGGAYGGQIPLARCVPLWGGVSEGGFAEVLAHPTKKLCSAEWAAAVSGGKLRTAIQRLKPVLPRGPWKVLCDNETFLHTALSKAAHEDENITMWRIPRKSPDLNPVESLRFKKRHQRWPLLSSYAPRGRQQQSGISFFSRSRTTGLNSWSIDLSWHWIWKVITSIITTLMSASF